MYVIILKPLFHWLASKCAYYLSKPVGLISQSVNRKSPFYEQGIASGQPDEVLSGLAGLDHQLWEMVSALRYPDLREACAIWELTNACKNRPPLRKSSKGPTNSLYCTKNRVFWECERVIVVVYFLVVLLCLFYEHVHRKLTSVDSSFFAFLLIDRWNYLENYSKTLTLEVQSFHLLDSFSGLKLA